LVVNTRRVNSGNLFLCSELDIRIAVFEILSSRLLLYVDAPEF
jgi:hypothetical protein